MSKIIAVMLQNGAEFIAEAVGSTPTSVTLKNPVTIIQDQSGNARFAPWFAFAAEREFTFNCSEIMLNMEAGAEVVSGYEQAFGLIQTIPEKKIIV